MSLCVGVSVYMKKRKYNCVYNTTREYQRLYVEIEEQHQYPHIFRSVCGGIENVKQSEWCGSLYKHLCIVCLYLCVFKHVAAVKCYNVYACVAVHTNTLQTTIYVTQFVFVQIEECGCVTL